MAHGVSSTEIQISDTFEQFLEVVQKGTKEEVDNFLGERASKYRESQSDTSKQLEKALEKSDVVEVWKLIAKANDENEMAETLENLTETCRTIAENETNKEGGCNFKCTWDLKKLCKTFVSSICWIFQCNEEEIEENIEMRSEKEQTWIKILSNPLYIGLEWLWRNNPKSQYKKGIRRKESKFADVIEAALDDAYLLEKIASYEHHYSRDDYTKRALEYEKFAAGVVEQINTTDLKQLHEIMDIEGNGSLLEKKPVNFNQSLSLLKMAADKKRKKFVASPKCQYVLNEIVYRRWKNWQDKGIVRKTFWFFLQLLLVTITCLVYIPVRLIRRCCSCHNFEDECCWKLRKLYEYPYSKFINHTMSYVVFLCFVFASSFQDEFGTTPTGLAWIDFVVLAFVIGLLFQEALEAIRQGLANYISKWWNVVDTLIVFTFLLAYTVWLSTWGYYGEWKPRKNAFIVADTIYASATVMAFFHLAHVFQVNSVLGPLQLSLYKMLKDVLKFLAIFLLLYIAFATGVAKIYSYYVASQIKLREQGVSHHQVTHPYGKHTDTFIGMFWLLLGLVEEDKISVEDPAFTLTSTFGRLFMIAHVVCTVIVALNMLIAMMNNSFEKIMENAVEEWKFSRTRMWLEWIDKGNTIPVPFNTLYYFLYAVLYPVLYIFCSNCCKTCCCKEGQHDQQQGNAQVQVSQEQGNAHGNAQAQVSDAQGNVQAQQVACCRTYICIRTCGISRCTIGCTCCREEKHSMREERMQEMKTLVVKYLKKRYEEKWKELTSLNPITSNK